jgi:hypothetical protein
MVQVRPEPSRGSLSFLRVHSPDGSTSGASTRLSFHFQRHHSAVPFLCELAIARPHEMPSETMTDRVREPDGFIFEVLVALPYAECGWAVEFLPEGGGPMPDMCVEARTAISRRMQAASAAVRPRTTHAPMVSPNRFGRVRHGHRPSMLTRSPSKAEGRLLPKRGGGVKRRFFLL